jgi:nucleoside-diphosphate-sugar epimerase
MTEPRSLSSAVDGTDAVVHLAAFFRGATPDQMESVNHRGTVELARLSVAAHVKRFVFASTSLVYPSGLRRPASESDPVMPAFAYPASKLAAEQSARHSGRRRPRRSHLASRLRLRRRGPAPERTRLVWPCGLRSHW